MHIFQVLTVRGPRAARGLPPRVFGFRATRKTPGYAPDLDSVATGLRVNGIDPDSIRIQVSM